MTHLRFVLWLAETKKEISLKQVVYSPTVNTTSVLLTLDIEAKENCDIWVNDIPDKFVQTENEDKVLIKIQSKASELLVITDSKLYQ